MSSAKNHRIRSHRSYRSSVSAAERFQQNQVVKYADNRAMKEKRNIFAMFMGLLKKGER